VPGTEVARRHRGLGGTASVTCQLIDQLDVTL
jgi:hypothetical protein